MQWLKAHDLDERTYAIFFKMINSTKVCAGTPMEAEYSQIFEKACQQFPTLKEIKDNDIVEQANAYFQRIYTSRQTIEDAIEMLKRFKNSNDPRETDIFKCMIHNLFDEYRFFHKYPEKELRITGILFGTLIQHQLVQNITLGIALRYVLEALRLGARGYLLKDAAAQELELALRALSRNESYLSPGIAQTVIQSAVLDGRDASVATPSVLTPRQTEILRLIARGCSTREIAEGLGLSVKTIETHRSQIMDRLNVHDVPSLVLYAVRTGLVNPDD